MVGFAVSAGPVVSSAGSSTGEDEEGATTAFSLAIANANSGLLTTDGDAITLTLESGIVVGRDAGGNAVFAISIDAVTGVVSVAQYKSIEHPTGGGSYDEPVNLGATVNAVMTVTDGDGDVATNSVAIGSQIVFEDDGPSAAIAVTPATGDARRDGWTSECDGDAGRPWGCQRQRRCGSAGGVRRRDHQVDRHGRVCGERGSGCQLGGQQHRRGRRGRDDGLLAGDRECQFGSADDGWRRHHADAGGWHRGWPRRWRQRGVCDLD